MSVVRNGLADLNVHVERNRRLTFGPDLDVVLARLEVQVLEDAVEVVDVARVVAVGEDLRVLGGVLDLDAAETACHTAVTTVVAPDTVVPAVAVGVAVPVTVRIVIRR